MGCGAPLTVAAAGEADGVFADLVVALLATHGLAARRSEDANADVVASLAVPAVKRSRVHITPLPCEGCIPVSQLLDHTTAPTAVLSLSRVPALAS